MPAVYTPSATHHNTGNYHTTGEVYTEVTGSELAKFAMDNIAVLAGSNTRQTVTRLQTVADLAALKAIAAADRADQDYCLIDTANGERLYKFDSAGAGTGDDYAIVTPTAGTGRWHLVNAKPKTTTLRRVACGIEFEYSLQDAVTTPAVSYTTMRRKVYFPDVVDVVATIRDLNTGDSISEIELVTECVVATAGITAVFYHVRSADGGTAPTVTTMGTITDPGGAVTSQSAAVAPAIVWQAGDFILIRATMDTTGGAGGNTVELVWAAVNGIRSYITE